MPDREVIEQMAMRLAVLHFRMQCRVDAIMERAGGDFKVACESSGTGLSYLLTKECANATAEASKLLYKLIGYSEDGEKPAQAQQQRWSE